MFLLICLFSSSTTLLDLGVLQPFHDRAFIPSPPLYISISDPVADIMFDKGPNKFFGLRGFQLNLAIGILAGLDFLYDPLLLTSTHNLN